ncbi:BTAD domain-containing putative transcriptional regulator [Lysobacter korlensis]|uniref:BTAD domain-containing putative transcriptional regulator n=1 Tax=Lysobacter korlensis TaxID=553636 RepID=A0ABV6S0Q9_9GAMM
MATRINLLGPPSIEADGTHVPPPRGSKSWALLAYLLLSSDMPPRSRLAELLFDEADDPAGTLRWSLSQVRRALGPSARIDGDPVCLALEDGTTVDVRVLTDRSPTEALALPGFGMRLLDGIAPHVGAAFEVWLSTERRRLMRITQAVLQEAAHRKLAENDAGAAVDLAARAVTAEPLNESSQELLVRALVASGELAEARRQVERCLVLFRRELGADPSPAVARALQPPAVPPSAATRGAILAELEAGAASYRAGGYDRAIDLLRSAVQGARRLRDPELLAQALETLGTAMVHGVRGSDQEAVTLLHESAMRARATGADHISAHAFYELGHIELLRGNYPRSKFWLARAAEVARDRPALRAWIGIYSGLGRSDQADYQRAVAVLTEAGALGREMLDPRPVAFANSGLGRVHLLRGDQAAARAALDTSCRTARHAGWTSFLPFPEAMRAELNLAAGRIDEAAEELDHSYELAVQVGDPAWQGYSLRGRGLLAARAGRDADALQLLRDGLAACHGVRDSYDWIEAACLDSLCDFAVRNGMDEAPGWVGMLDDFASRRGMREMVARAALHRVRLREDGAEDAASLLVAAIDNPALHALAADAGVRPALAHA